MTFKNLNHTFFASVAELRAMLDAPWNEKSNKKLATSHMERDNGASWHGIDGGAKAVVACVENGYDIGEKAIREFSEAIKAALPRAVGVNRVKVKGDSGDDLDVHAVNRGDFSRAWTSSKRRVRTGSTSLRLCIDIGANASMNADALQWRGIAGLALAEIMTKAGYNVEIIACCAIRDHWVGSDNEATTFSVVVKDRNARPDLGLLAATVALPGFFRSYGFAALIRSADDMKQKANSGLGRYLDVSGVLPVPERMTQLFVQGTVHDRASAIDWVKQSVTLLQGARA